VRTILKYKIQFIKIIFGVGTLFLWCIPGFSITNPLNLRRACKAKNDSDIILKWTIPNDACASFKSYQIYGRSVLSAPFDTIDSVKTLSQNFYVHKGAFMIANSWQYFVVVQFDCNGVPTISSDTISIDFTQTADQYIDSVSFDPTTGKYIIGWKTNTSSDLAGYKIYTVSGSNNIEIADLNNAINQYVDFSSTPATSTKTYSIAAYDSCNNITAIIDKQTPIKLSVSFDSCSHVFSLAWTGYVGFPLSKYEIITSINGGTSFTIRDFLNVSGPLNYALLDTVFHDGDLVCFSIRGRNANNNSISSSSNPICIQVKFISEAIVNYISMVNVIDTASVRVDWFTEAPGFISKALLQQSVNGISFITRRTFIPSSNNTSFTLDSLDTHKNKYYYRIIIYNSCNVAQKPSNVCNSILLTAGKIKPSTIRLNWCDYLDFDANIEKYEIYQGTGDALTGHTYILTATVIPDSLGYNDNNLPENVLNDGVCYYILAYENPLNNYGIIGATCKSNEVCVPGEMIVFFPNAFKPGSLVEKNINFKPRGLYIDYTKSTMQIYNRWGDLVFETNDIQKGWDGTDKNGVQLPEGCYICLANVIALKGKNQFYNGFITLLR